MVVAHGHSIKLFAFSSCRTVKLQSFFLFQQARGAAVRFFGYNSPILQCFLGSLQMCNNSCRQCLAALPIVCSDFGS
ncbi:unnamed protein product [Urochloa humidicola]